MRALGLLTADGEVASTPSGRVERTALLAATIGGMGLTGVILSARIALRPASGMLAVDTDRAPTLDHALALLSAPGGPHRVAWLDLLGARPGRGIVTRAESSRPPTARCPGASRRGRGRPCPRGGRAALLSPATVSAFNELRFGARRVERGRIGELGSHMFPLDVLDAWPRLYGPPGFLQYQLVVPSGAENVLGASIDCIRRAAVPCYLAVLKDFGPANGCRCRSRSKGGR